MGTRATRAGISSPAELQTALDGAQYIADDALATAAYLALALGKPLLLEGAPGVGKTEAAKALDLNYHQFRRLLEKHGLLPSK